LLVIGKKYIFNEHDINQLKKLGISFEYIDENINLNTFKKKLKKNTIIVLNNKIPISNEYLTYFTTLKLKGKKFITIDLFLEKYLKKIYIPRENINLDFLEEIKPLKKSQYIQKRILDYIIGIPFFIITLPIMLYASYKIKKESPQGNIIFKQKRVGLNGKEFVCYKFRSMIPNAEVGKPEFAKKNDPRTFRWGAFMRKTRIDELPQLINVFKGEMHLVGPRPERKYWVDIFKKTIPSYDQRHLIKPGITGWAQVNYPYGANEYDAWQKLMYDLYYIKNWSVRLEILTLFKTIKTILKGSGL